MPEQVCEAQYLLFANEGHPGDIMRGRVPSSVDEADDGRVMEFARNPQEREFRSGTRRFAMRPAEGSSHERMWPVRPESGTPFRTGMHVEKPLGELTAADLEDIAGCAPQR